MTLAQRARDAGVEEIDVADPPPPRCPCCGSEEPREVWGRYYDYYECFSCDLRFDEDSDPVDDICPVHGARCDC